MPGTFSAADLLLLGTLASCLVLSTSALAQEATATETAKPTDTVPSQPGEAASVAKTAETTGGDAPDPTSGEAPAVETAGQAEGSTTVDATASASTEAETSAGTEEASSGESSGGLFESSASGDDTGSADETASPSFDLDGYVRSDVFMGKVPDYTTAAVRAAYGELALRLRASGGSEGDAFAEMRLRYGQQGPRYGLITDLREAYVNAYLGPLDLRLGHQIIVWGRADGFNPTNNLTPIDLRVRSPIEDDRRVGNVAARAFLNFEPFQLEAAWVPVYKATELPDIVFPEYTELGDPNYPAAEWPRSSGGARLHLLLSAVEMSVSYFRGYGTMPGLALQDYQVGPEAMVRVSRTAYEQQVFGFDFSTALGEQLGVRGEAAYRLPEKPDAIHVPDPDLQYVLGLDRSFGSLSVIAQYVGHYVFDWKHAAPQGEDALGPSFLVNLDETMPDSTVERIATAIDTELAYRNQLISQQTKELQHLASLRLEYLAFHDTLTLTALGLYNFNTKELIAYPRIGYQFSDRMSTSLGAELYMGPDGTLMGMIDEQMSAGYAELRYSF